MTERAVAMERASPWILLIPRLAPARLQHRGARRCQRPDDGPGNATGDRLTIRAERGLSGTTLPDLNGTTTVMRGSGEGFSSVAIRKATKTSRNRSARKRLDSTA